MGFLTLWVPSCICSELNVERYMLRKGGLLVSHSAGRMMMFLKYGFMVYATADMEPEPF
jgi:hypothetical protein